MVNLSYPALRGDEDPFKKRSWIYSQIGDFRMIRDWYHIIDNKGAFHNLLKDPRQEREVNPQDKIAPGRPSAVTDDSGSFPEKCTSPFPGVQGQASWAQLNQVVTWESNPTNIESPRFQWKYSYHTHHLENPDETQFSLCLSAVGV